MRKLCIPSILEEMKRKDKILLHPDFSRNILLQNYNFILTYDSRNRLDEIFTYVSKGISVILGGETGTSKTLSAEIISNYIYEKNKEKNEKENNTSEKYEDKTFIKFNFSREVKINDLIKKLIVNKSSISVIKIVEGPFYKAFKNGMPLILDEINFASQEVLQFIESALDNKLINIEIPGIGLVNQKMEKGFCLIAIQNIDKERINLSQSFLSHFKIIKFFPLKFEEKYKISIELFKYFNDKEEILEYEKRFIEDLIRFHIQWTSNEKVKNGINCFTIREIIECIKAYINDKNKNVYKIVKVIYGSRYRKEDKNKLLQLLTKYYNFRKE